MSVLSSVLGSKPPAELFSPQQREMHAILKERAIARLSLAFGLTKTETEDGARDADDEPAADTPTTSEKA